MSKWVVKIQDTEYETSFEDLKKWIIEGRVLSEDLVLRKGLGWKKAGEIAELEIAFIEQQKKPAVRPEFQKSELVKSPYPRLYQNYSTAFTVPTLQERSLAFFLDKVSYLVFASSGFLLDFLKKREAVLDGIDPNEIYNTASYAIMIFGYFINLSLNIYFTSQYGGSIGKLIIGLVVLDEKSQNYLPYWKAALREILKDLAIASCKPLTWWLIFDTKRQQLYDKLIGANVYSR